MHANGPSGRAGCASNGPSGLAEGGSKGPSGLAVILQRSFGAGGGDSNGPSGREEVVLDGPSGLEGPRGRQDQETIVGARPSVRGQAAFARLEWQRHFGGVVADGGGASVPPPGMRSAESSESARILALGRGSDRGGEL